MRLKECREKAGLSQQQLATELGITRQAVSLYEQGKREPKLDVIRKMSDILNVGVFYLLGEHDQDNDNTNKTFDDVVAEPTALAERAFPTVKFNNLDVKFETGLLLETMQSVLGKTKKIGMSGKYKEKNVIIFELLTELVCYLDDEEYDEEHYSDPVIEMFDGLEDLAVHCKKIYLGK
ncbi:helix-turn-helix transcriptional regulator [Periweissella fabaria]|uniref:HTH cro/C1-type domain-containing protein n=1 Tax=Periweissella fabaria TaxID=546157 RepID=A0ABN8BL28_9LACO|nr:helix-turn-helix transcriptional regulator [Periweissella fabaria]MCM0597727.1 helix-turn-helix transcriptional regulator [Periweissella fabaria]CAH0417176.1 hypothetical protein WFA24289_01505 [Periweissella fabaria]